MTQKINLKKIEIADAQKNKPTAEMYDEIIVSLSQELIDLERKVREVICSLFTFVHVSLERLVDRGSDATIGSRDRRSQRRGRFHF